MAKRKRLTPAILASSDKGLSSGSEASAGRPPIARVAGETAAEAALAEVADALSSARAEGRLIVRLPLDAIEAGHLVRDRIAFDPEEMAALKASIAARGQQVPIEVVTLQHEGRYGLISGLRRVMALREIGAGEVLALVRQPDNSADAYLAMVEENEIRAGISFYERARVAAEAVRLGLFETTAAAITHLFTQASPAKRSKIGSFVVLHHALGDTLRFPVAIPERLGLAMVKALSEDRGFARQLASKLEEAAPGTAAAERQVIEAVLRGRGGRPSSSTTLPEVAPGVFLDRAKGRVVLSGPGVDAELADQLCTWLKTLRT